jgi:SAM-dependent methyltransferase
VSAAASLSDYYAARVAEYEQVYAKPERQADLANLRELVPKYFHGERVLELACGTGYWTALISEHAELILATDVTPDVLVIARAKTYPRARVSFHLADAFAVADIPGDFTAAFAGFWWSHISLAAMPGFLSALHQRLGSGARVMFLDNRFVDGSSTPLDHADADGNTYQRRQLANGSEHCVLKNFPSPNEIRERIEVAGASEVDVVELPHYWMVTYRVVVTDLDRSPNDVDSAIRLPS